MYILKLYKTYKQSRINGGGKTEAVPPPLMRPAGGKGWVKNKGKFSGRRRTKSYVADNESNAHDQRHSYWITSGCYMCCIAFGRYPIPHFYVEACSKNMRFSARKRILQFSLERDTRINKRRVSRLNLLLKNIHEMLSWR